MEKDLPGTIIDFQTDPSTEVVNETVFKRLFWAFRPCILGFKFCKPIVQIDATWLYGKYKGTLLLTVVQDGNNKIFPIAFAIVEGETKEAWSFFLKNLRQHVTEGEKNHKKGGLNCVFGNFFFYVLDNCSQVQSRK